MKGCEEGRAGGETGEAGGRVEEVKVGTAGCGRGAEASMDYEAFVVRDGNPFPVH